MKKKNFFLLLTLACFFASFQIQHPQHFIIPLKWPKPIYDFKKNPINRHKITLGRALFYDPILSRDNTISCATCHSPYTAFAHIDHKLSHGIDNKIGTRNAPALMNLAWQSDFMWDGAINHLDMQALAPITNPVEMDETLLNCIRKQQKSKIYPQLYKQAFGDTAIQTERMLKALAQFMLTLTSYNSRYDSVMRMKVQFTEQEKNGYRLFQVHCSSCHKEPLFSTYQFENNGLEMDTVLKDLGRMKITKRSEDSLKFKVPSLRNIEFSFPYMHDGRFKKLSDVLNHYNGGIVKSKTLAPQLQKPMQLSPNDKVDIIAFLLTLTDKQFLFNVNQTYPKAILMK